MDLPNAKQRQGYIDSVKALEEELKRATDGNDVSDVALHSAQEQLDTLAEKYQNDEKIGTARYKLYELQAFIYYFEHKDSEALDFINQAIETKGGSYPKAEKLKDTLSAPTERKQSSSIDESKLTKAQKRKKLIGLEGWLALFIVGQFLALLMTIYRFFADGFTSSSDIDALNEYQSGLGDSLQALTAFENLAILIYVALIITTLVLLFRRSKLAKPFAIATLIFSAIYGILDYAIASSMFSADIFQTAEMQSMMSKYAGDVGRSVVAALIWTPYFLVSKRVKATLTK